MRRPTVRTFAALALAAAFARADDAGQSQVAEALFQQAKALMDAKSFAEACPKLRESYRLDPAGGTVLLLAKCEEGQNHLASAWSAYQEALGVARRDHRDDRETRAHERIADLEPRLSMLVVDVAPAVAKTAGLRITRDGVEIPPPAWGLPIPVDGGSHLIATTAPGKKPREDSVEVGAEKDKRTVRIDALIDAPAEAPPPIASAPSSAAPPPTAPPPPVERGPGPLRVASYVVGGVGIVGLGVGTYFGVHTLSLKSDANAICPQARCGDRGAVTKSSDAHTSAQAANATLIGGTALLAAGVVMFLVSGEPSKVGSVRVAPTVGRNGVALAAGGAF